MLLKHITLFSVRSVENSSYTNLSSILLHSFTEVNKSGTQFSEVFFLRCTPKTTCQEENVVEQGKTSTAGVHPAQDSVLGVLWIWFITQFHSYTTSLKRVSNLLLLILTQNDSTVPIWHLRGFTRKKSKYLTMLKLEEDPDVILHHWQLHQTEILHVIGL